MQPMSGVSRRFQTGLLAAGCLLTAACALAEPKYFPVPGSALVSRPELRFKLAHEQRGSSRVTLLLHQPSVGDPLTVATISASQSGSATNLSFQLLLRPEADANSSAVNVATLEHLYALAVQQAPEAKYCMVSGTQPCDVAKDRLSHAELLRELVMARQRAIAHVIGQGDPSVPWRVVSMVTETLDGDADQVGVRVTNDQGPMEGATVFFNRAPHSGCMAKSRANGVATCHLVDREGDEDSHTGEEKVAVVATFPGDVRADRVLVPTTLVLSAR